MARNMEYHQKVEQSLLKKYRKELWTPFITAVNRYELIQPGDKIAVCISGGKDSMCMAKLMQEVQRHGKVPFEAEFLVMDPGYNAANRRKIEENAAAIRAVAEAGLKDDAMVKEAEKRFDDALAFILERTKHA